MPIDVIIYALVALVLVLALRHVLGTRAGDERSRPNPFMGKVLDAQPKPAVSALAGPATNAAYKLPSTAGVAPAAQIGLAVIGKADNGFDLARFVHGAQDAFVLIVEAFANGDRATLRDLLSEPVLQAFTTVMDRRENAGEKASVEILAIRRVDVTAAALQDRTISITVRFVADQTLSVRDRDGKVIEGNPDRVAETIDIWTFTHDVAAQNQPWRVTMTRQEDAPATSDAAPPAAG